MPTDYCMNVSKMNVLGTAVTTGTYHEFIQAIFALVKSKTASYVCFANVHMVMEAHNNPDFQWVVNQAALVAPDGKPISLFLNFFHNTKQVRVCGMDIFPSLLRAAEITNKSVYLYGATDELLSIIKLKAEREFPELVICGAYSPPFRELTAQEVEEDLHRIKKARPDMVFVSLGCPKQEKWMAAHYAELGTCLLGVGQAFSVYAGIEKRLPVWMRDLSLEWLYRLYLEPRRLWRRYLFTNSGFLILTVRYWATLKYRSLLSRVTTAPFPSFSRVKK